MGLERIKNALLTVSKNVGHYKALREMPPYIVWAEDGTNDPMAGDGHADRLWTGTVDLYTKTEHDQLVEDIENALETENVSWGLNSIQFEDDTGLVHYEWVFEVD